MAAAALGILLLLLVTFQSSLGQNVSIFQSASVPASIWSANKTFSGIGSETVCSALTVANNQCQFWFDPAERTCEVGNSPIYRNGTGPMIDIQYRVTNGTFTQWTTWSLCTATCYGGPTATGTERRTRGCLGSGAACPSPTSASTCNGATLDSRMCPYTTLCNTGRTFMIVGGVIDSSGTVTSTVDVVDIYKPSCRVPSSYPFPVKGATGTFTKNVTIVCGGMSNNVVQSSCYTYNIDNDSWAQNYSMSKARYQAASTAMFSSFQWWIAGGFDGTNATSTTEVYNASSGFSSGVHMPSPIFNHHLQQIMYTSYNNVTALVFGGNDFYNQNQPYTINWLSGAVTLSTNSFYPTSATGGVLEGSNNIMSTEPTYSQYYVVANDTWINATSLAVLPMQGGVPNQYVSKQYVFGGQIGVVPQNGVYHLNSAAKTWDANGTMPRARYGHTVIGVPDMFC